MANQLIHPGYISTDASTNGQLLVSNGSYASWSSNVGTITFSGNLVISTSVGLSTNGSYGISGQVLTTNGSTVSWSTPSAPGFVTQFNGHSGPPTKQSQGFGII